MDGEDWAREAEGGTRVFRRDTVASSVECKGEELEGAKGAKGWRTRDDDGRRAKQNLGDRSIGHVLREEGNVGIQCT